MSQKTRFHRTLSLFSWLSQLRLAQQLANKNLRAAHRRQKVLYDQQFQGEELRVGDRVCLYCPAVKPGCTKKFAILWRSPYAVIDKTGSVNYKIQLIGRLQTTIVHQTGWSWVTVSRNHARLAHSMHKRNHYLLSQPRINLRCQWSLPVQQPKPISLVILLLYTVILWLGEHRSTSVLQTHVML